MKYVVLGSSAAGINGIRELRRLDPSGEILLVSKDRDIYSRCILHHYLGGERTLEQLHFAEKDFDRRYRVEWRRETGCTGIDRNARQVFLDNGEKVSYDRLLIATGSHTYLPDIPGLGEAANASGFRNLEDIAPLKEAAASGKRIVVMGAGLVGMDCVTGLLDAGAKPVLVETAPWMLKKQLDETAARRYQEAFAARGVEQYYGRAISRVVLDDQKRITELLLEDGTSLPCGWLVVTAGVRANVEFLEGSGLALSPLGLAYDETGRTSDPYIYGAGDVSGARPIWPVAVKEGIIAASNMAGGHQKMTDFFASKSTMNFLGIPSMSVGEVNPPEGQMETEVRETKDSYKKILHKDGRITGAVLQGDLAYGGILQQLIARKIDITRVKKPVFDIDYSDFFHMDENFEYYWN